MQLTKLLKTTRQYFWDLNFDEVEISYLNTSLPLEPNLYAFQTKEFFLPTSPEFALKKHLASTKKNCFSIAHCFRDLEAESPYHTKEFLMLEYYLVNQNLSDLQKSLENYISLFIRNLKFEIRNLPADLPDNEPDFNQYFLNNIEPNLPKDKAVFITGYPAFLSPLASVSESNLFSAQSVRSEAKSASGGSTAKIMSSNNQVAARFELYINGIEIANGCTENTNAVSIKKAFEQEKQHRLKNHLPLHPYSQDFIFDSAKLGKVSGLGLGINRLLKIINQQ